MNQLEEIFQAYNKNEFLVLNEEMTFDEYLERVQQNPKLIRTAYQRIWDMISSKGTEEIEIHRKTITKYKFFSDSEIPIFGLEESLDRLAKFIHGAAGGYGPEKRVLLLHGPVGSSKSTICRLIKRGLEKYSKTDEGAWYSYKWVNLPTGPNGIYVTDTDISAMNEDPLKLMPIEIRNAVVAKLNQIHRNSYPEEERSQAYNLYLNGELNPRCKFFMKELLKKYKGDWKQVCDNHITVIRRVYSESDRVGIATFQPKDEKNQDSTELTGDINFSKIALFGSDSDPRAFSFDGELCVGNRGIVEFIEMLKLEQAFLYDLLGASQERSIKPKKFSQISVDEAIFGHSNNAEYEKLKNNPYMEALRDRTFKVDIPYLLSWEDELQVLQQDYGKGKVHQHVAPHTLEIAALWAILTRLKDDPSSNISLVEKADLYNGKLLTGWTEDSVKELKDKHPQEGMAFGVSVRYIQDKIAVCLSERRDYINPFIVMNEIKDGLSNHSLIVNKDQIGRYNTCCELAIKKLDDILKNEVQTALVGNEKAIVTLCENYIDNLMAYIDKNKIKNPYTNKEEAPDERLMRSIESKIDVPEAGADDFRRMIAGFIGKLHHQKKSFTWDSNERLRKALEMKLFEDTREHIKISSLSLQGGSVVDSQMQEKIDAVKARLISHFGYNEQSASDVLNHVGSIFARGDVVEKD